MQQRCTQIEKEMLAIMHGCKKFHDYLFWQPQVAVKLDHKQLEAIFDKQLYQCPLQLQRMHLSLQKYPIAVKYKPGKELFIADALSRFPNASLLKEHDKHFQVNVIYNLPFSDSHLMQVQEETVKDSTMPQLHRYASTSWPDNKNDVIPKLRSYWAFHEELDTQEGLVLRSNLLIIPPKMSGEIIWMLACCTRRTRKDEGTCELHCIGRILTMTLKKQRSVVLYARSAGPEMLECY